MDSGGLRLRTSFASDVAKQRVMIRSVSDVMDSTVDMRRDDLEAMLLTVVGCGKQSSNDHRPKLEAKAC